MSTPLAQSNAPPIESFLAMFTTVSWPRPLQPVKAVLQGQTHKILSATP